MVSQPSGTVTLVFTDIAGSTRLLHDLGPEAYREALGEHRRLVRAAFARFEGYEVDYEGDAFFYAFVSAEAAVTAVTEALVALDGGPIRIRVGVHTGDPIVDPPKYIGMDVHTAARIMSAGHGGQVLLSRRTRDLIQADVLDLGEHRLKDIDEPVWLFQLGGVPFPPLKTISNTNLPVPASSFVGRREELEKAAPLLASTRLLTVVGTGGTGKTRFAIELASSRVGDYPNGVFWVPLAPLRDPALVTGAAEQAVGAPSSLVEHIGERRMLLVFDNFEHVVDAAPELSELLAACPRLSLLVTSRELLRIQGETAYRLPPLDEGEGVELFCQRAGMARTPVIEELCARLDNLPLAIELAAARAGLLTPEQLLGRLSRRLDVLKGGRDMDARQQTLRATIEWSYDLLDQAERELFARLSVFAGGCTAEVAEAVCDADLDPLHSLVDKSLVRTTTGRLWMLETLREYAAERLEQSGQHEAVSRRHMVWFVEFAEEANAQSRTGRRDEWFDRLEPEVDNLRVALDAARAAGESELELRLATALWRFWADRGYVREGARRLGEALERNGDQPAAALLGRAYFGSLTGRSHTDILAEVTAIAAVAEADGDRFTRVQALSIMGIVTIALGRVGPAERVLEDALALADGDYPADEAEAIGWLLIGAFIGPLPTDDGIRRCRDASTRARGNRVVEAFALAERAALEAMRGDFEVARRHLAQSREAFAENDLKVFGANTAQEGYHVEMLAGDPAAALTDLAAAYALLDEMGERGFLSSIAGYAALAAYAVADFEAVDAYAALCADTAADDDLLSQSLWRSARAKRLSVEGDFEKALRHAYEAVALTDQTDWINTRADRLADLAEVLRMAQRPAEAADALGQALGLYDRKGNLVSAERTREARRLLTSV